MGLLDIFQNDQDGLRRSYVKNMVCVAMADGNISTDEWDLLVAISRVMGITENEISSIRQAPDKVKFVAPKKYEDKVQHIQDLVAVMTIDGSISARELDLCRKISLRLDILPQMVDDIIHDMINPNPASSRK